MTFPRPKVDSQSLLEQEMEPVYDDGSGIGFYMLTDGSIVIRHEEDNRLKPQQRPNSNNHDILDKVGLSITPETGHVKLSGALVQSLIEVLQRGKGASKSYSGQYESAPHGLYINENEAHHNVPAIPHGQNYKNAYADHDSSLDKDGAIHKEPGIPTSLGSGPLGSYIGENGASYTEPQIPHDKNQHNGFRPHGLHIDENGGHHKEPANAPPFDKNGAANPNEPAIHQSLGNGPQGFYVDDNGAIHREAEFPHDPNYYYGHGLHGLQVDHDDYNGAIHNKPMLSNIFKHPLGTFIDHEDDLHQTLSNFHGQHPFVPSKNHKGFCIEWQWFM